MKAKLPEFLLEMSKQMREQPNRATSHPFWQVRCKRHIVTEEGCNESHFEIVGDDGDVFYHSEKSESFEELAIYLIEYHEDWCVDWCDDNGLDPDKFAFLDNFPNDYVGYDFYELPSEIRKVHMQEIEEVISTHLTKSDAEWFIKRKQHDYPKLYTYVESAYWSPQLKQLQDWIISLGGHDEN